MKEAVTLFQIDPDLSVVPLLKSPIFVATGVQHIGQAGFGARGLKLCKELNPKIVLIDPGLPDIDGFSIVGELVGLPSNPSVLIFSTRVDEVMLHQCQSAPISGLVWKTEKCLENLFAAIGEIIAGRMFFPPEFKKLSKDLARQNDAFFKILTKRELQLLPLFGKGSSDEDIARRFGVRPGTVRIQRQSVMGKLGLHRREEMMLWAIEKGFAHFPRPAPPCEFA